MERNAIRLSLFSNDLDQHPLPSSTIKLAVEYLLPRVKVQAVIRDCRDGLAAQELPLHMRVRMILPRTVVPVLAHRLVWSQLLKPVVVILVQAALSSLLNTLEVMRIHEQRDRPSCMLVSRRNSPT